MGCWQKLQYARSAAVVGEVLPPPGTLIGRLPGFIRAAGATHRLAELPEGSKLIFVRYAVPGVLSSMKKLVPTPDERLSETFNCHKEDVQLSDQELRG
jgi:hypothetical protein